MSDAPARSADETDAGGDSRDALYRDLHARQLVAEEGANYRSATRILEILLRHYRPRSVLDVGCGIGTWLKALEDRGIDDLMGIDGTWLDPNQLQIHADVVGAFDLEKPFDLGRRFDLVISLEVAEHLSESAAGHFVDSLVRHAPAVLFSAAIPHQGGHHHVNEQFLSYWIERFAAAGYVPVDFIRGEVWHDPEVLWWLRQNTMFFAQRELVEANDALRGYASSRAPLSVVHPDLYLREADERTTAAAIVALLRTGVLFRVEKDAHGRLTVTRVE